MADELDQEFDRWFDDNFPREHFGALGILRLSIKEDVARKAFKLGREIERERCTNIAEIMEGAGNHRVAEAFKDD